MDNQLFTLSKIFTERLFRIPDYQRGYAWTERQLKDFWADISQLEATRNHYTGVLTLEAVPDEKSQRWDDDRWIVSDKSYQPFYVVDGQQRLTTAIVLMQAICERLGEDDKLNHNTKSEIQKKFLFDSKDDGISRSYVFGYERDNPSYEFLKARVFQEKITSGALQETVYTQNLENAKLFFVEKLDAMQLAEIETIYRKLTQHLLFNIFTISDDVDVCVAFETMNNRGKPLSYLELLKNRLIYLSYKLNEPESERLKLRSAINDCWRAIYHSLGKNKEKPLDDDRFLLTHYIIYFGRTLLSNEPDEDDDDMRYHRLLRVDYPRALLEKTFIAKNIFSDDADAKLDLKLIFRYVSSLQEAVETWYKIFNPHDSGYSLEVRLWLDKLNRLGVDPYLPLLLVFLQRVNDEKRVVHLLQSIERHLFLLGLTNRYLGRAGMHYFPLSIKWAMELDEEALPNAGADRVTRHINELINGILKSEFLWKHISDHFRINGFYGWDSIRYFLFEYNLDLQAKSKTDRPKILWPEFIEHKKDYVSVEHIYPQQARHPYWVSRFAGLSPKRKSLVRNSLGNLLPLSRPKNSSLSNKPFDEKARAASESVISYSYGSYAEIEIADLPEWTPQQILTRGLKLLQFMERRWGLNLGDERQKTRLLGLDFLMPKSPSRKAVVKKGKKGSENISV